MYQHLKITTSILSLSLSLSLSLQLLERDPKIRLGCIEDREPIRRHAFFADIDWDLLESRKMEPPYKPKIVCDEYMKHLL